MDTKSLIISAFLIFIVTSVNAQQTYTLQGTVYDSTSNQPVEDAQVWLHGAQKGDLTDSLGQFKFKIFKMHSQTRTYVRICGKEIATSQLISFNKDSLIEVSFFVSNTRRDCQSPSNIPWKINPSKAKMYTGHFILTLSGGYIETCNGDSYSPAWPDDFAKKEIWRPNSKLGDRVYIQFKGSLDPYSENVIPFQTIYVGDIDKIKAPSKNDCSK